MENTETIFPNYNTRSVPKHLCVSPKRKKQLRNSNVVIGTLSF